jgi:hypothetical protein
MTKPETSPPIYLSDTWDTTYGLGKPPLQEEESSILGRTRITWERPRPTLFLYCVYNIPDIFLLSRYIPF